MSSREESSMHGEHHAQERVRPEAVVERVAALVAERLGRTVDADENFFDAGLDSLDLVQVHEAVTAELGLDLPATTLFASPNLSALAAFLATDGADAAGPGRERGGDRLRRAGAARRGVRSRARRDVGR